MRTLVFKLTNTPTLMRTNLLQRTLKMNTLESMDYFEYLSIKEAADELEELEALAQEWELYHNQESEWDYE